MDRKYAHAPCPECKRYTNRAVTVNMIVVRDGKILLIERGVEPYKGLVALPGGYLDWDETGEEGGAREALEEVGITVTEQMFLCFSSDPGRHPDQAVNATFVALAWTGEPTAGDDAVRFVWCPLHQLPGAMPFDHLKIVDTYRRWIAARRAQGGGGGHAHPF